MFFYQLDYVVEEVLKSVPTREQLFLKKYLKRDFSRSEAEYLWNRINDHKYFLGERLRRDAGMRVAAIDYVENFYEPNTFSGKNRVRSGVFGKILPHLSAALRSYFISKSTILPQ